MNINKELFDKSRVNKILLDSSILYRLRIALLVDKFLFDKKNDDNSVSRNPAYA